MAKVMIHPATYKSVRQAVDQAFELFPLEMNDKRVLIKPNVLRASLPQEGIATHPAVLRAVVEKVETLRPAAIVVGDNPGLFNYGANEDSFQKTGLMEAAKGYYQNIGNDSKKVDFNPAFSPAVSLYKAVLDADIIISFGSSPSRCGPPDIVAASGQAGDLQVPDRGAYEHARFSDHAGPSRHSHYRACLC